MKTLYFEIKGYGTENVAMATKFFGCLKSLHSHTSFHWILINNDQIIAHLNIYIIYTNTYYIIIFCFFSLDSTNLKSLYL